MEEKKNKKQNIKNQNTKNQKNENKVNDYKSLWDKERALNKALANKIQVLEKENLKNIADFQLKAENFSRKAQEEINKIKNKLNAKTEEERELIKKYGSQELFENILEPLANMEVAIASGKNNEAVKAYVQGFEMLLDQLFDSFESFGLFRIMPVIGTEFDPESHHAIAFVEGENKNIIVDVKKPGFQLYDRIIKPAVVVIEK